MSDLLLYRARRRSLFLLYAYGDHRDLHVLTPSLPTRRSSDLQEKAWLLRCMEVYASQIDRMDQGIGRILAALEETGQLDNTLVIFLRSEEHTSELQSLMRISYAVFCLNKKVKSAQFKDKINSNTNWLSTWEHTPHDNTQ